MHCGSHHSCSSMTDTVATQWNTKPQSLTDTSHRVWNCSFTSTPTLFWTHTVPSLNWDVQNDAVKGVYIRNTEIKVSGRQISFLASRIESWVFLSITVLNRVRWTDFFLILGYYYIFMLITPWSDSFGCVALNNTLNASAQALLLVSYCVCASVWPQKSHMPAHFSV